MKNCTLSRFLSLLLSFSMIFGMLPSMAVFAAEDENIEQSPIQDEVDEENATVFSSNTNLINKIEITGFTEPVYGAKPDFDLTIPEGVHYHFATKEELKECGYGESDIAKNINGVWWDDSKARSYMSAQETFYDNSKGFASFIILIPNDGYEFANGSDITVTINGTKTLVEDLISFPDTPELGIYTIDFFSIKYK